MSSHNRKFVQPLFELRGIKGIHILVEKSIYVLFTITTFTLYSTGCGGKTVYILNANNEDIWYKKRKENILL